MPRLRANGIDIEYELFGDPQAAPLLLVTGLGAQMISWDEAFCEQLAAHGFHVIRFDNRDSGLSTRLEAAGPPDVAAAIGGDPHPAYMLDDMAADAVGLLDALGIEAAHIVGGSMGGFIAQLIAINHPRRALSLTSIMSGPSWREGVGPTPEASAVLFAKPPSTPEQSIEMAITGRRALVGSGDPFDEAFERARATRAVQRAYYPVGTGRQLLAILAAKPRLEPLRGVRVPTLVIHGKNDILVPIENGRMVAEAVPGARLLELDGMGHDMPKRVWPQVIDAIVETARMASVTQPG
ncbi:MAG TPA: alpha/beta hydrolase [Candidatus Dormibacteraeota bacterium]|nr:alpha/beta hydrolase [Candidatus Dormibacteraeota bacterium]